jgi:choline transporter-like protein 2/4/5
MKNKLPFFTVLGSLGRTLFYHLGTLAFGSLLIAIVKIIRTIIEYFSNKFKSETNKSKIAKFIVAYV